MIDGVTDKTLCVVTSAALTRVEPIPKLLTYIPTPNSRLWSHDLLDFREGWLIFVIDFVILEQVACN